MKSFVTKTSKIIVVVFFPVVVWEHCFMRRRSKFQAKHAWGKTTLRFPISIRCHTSKPYVLF